MQPLVQVARAFAERRIKHRNLAKCPVPVLINQIILKAKFFCALVLAQSKTSYYDKNNTDDCSKYGVVNKNKEQNN